MTQLTPEMTLDQSVLGVMLPKVVREMERRV
jgi:hypothetical protein